MNLDSVSADDNFFALGGHSLMAVQILSKLKKKLGRSFQLAVLFKYPVYVGLQMALLITTKKKTYLYVLNGD